MQSSPTAQFSDHFNISFHIVSCASISRRCEPLFVFDYSKADFAGFCNYLLDINYSVCLQSDSIEYVWSYLKKLVKHKHFPHWYTVEPPNKGHLGTRASVPYSEVVLYSEVFVKIVFLHRIHVYNIIRVFHEMIQSASP